MTVKTENKHELRTRETRTLLLAAAETIFVRDGYKGAELGEIAALAGRTKGSIYAQFKSKEDIFLALVEDRALLYRAQVEEMLAKSTTIEGNKLALRSFYLQRVEDQAWSLLLLEFKLFAMRHPESKKRLKKMHTAFLTRDAEDRFAEVFGAAATGKNAISRVVAILALQPVVSALVLEAQLETHLSGKGVVAKVTNRIFDALMDGHARKKGSSS